MLSWQVEMGHVAIDVTIISFKGEHKLKNVLIGTGATYSVFPEEVLKDIGAFKLPIKVKGKSSNRRIGGN